MANEDLEFASAEDLELIKSNPSLEKVHRAMIAGVTKKFQEFSSTNKGLREENESLKTQNQELDNGLGQWEGWYTKNKPALDKFGEYLSGGGEKKRRSKKEEGEEVDDSDERFERLAQSMETYGKGLRGELTKMGRQLQLSVQLSDLYRRYPGMDGNKVLDVALKKGYTNLDDAYKDDDAYGKDLLEGRVKEALEPRLKEELAKRTTNVETGSGSTPLSFEMPKDIPKSFTDAGQQFLKERAEAANNPATLEKK